MPKWCQKPVEATKLYIILIDFKHGQIRCSQKATNQPKATFTPDGRPTPDQFLWLGRVWSGKMIEERIYPRLTLLYLRFIPDAPTLKSRSSRPTPILPADLSPLCTINPRPIPDATTLNVGPTPDLISTPGLKWIIQANVMPTDSLMWVQYPK